MLCGENIGQTTDLAKDHENCQKTCRPRDDTVRKPLTILEAEFTSVPLPRRKKGQFFMGIVSVLNLGKLGDCCDVRINVGERMSTAFDAT